MVAHPAPAVPAPAVPAPAQHATALQALVWRYGKALPATGCGLPTGFAELDRALPQHGWVGAGLNELLGNEQGIGEFSLLLPALRATCGEGRGVLLANPPFLPYAPALAQAGIMFAHLIVIRNARSDQLYWAAEQALRSKACGAVVLWSDEAARPLPDLLLRRLQVAAANGGCAGFLFRPRRAAEHASPAALRIVHAPRHGALEITLHKGRGVIGAPRVCVQPWRHPWAARAIPAIASPQVTSTVTKRHQPKVNHHALDRSPSSRSFATGDHARIAPAHPGRDH